MAQVFGHKYELYVGMPSRLVEMHNAPTPYDDEIPVSIKQPNLDKSLLTGGYVDYLTVDSTFRKITNPIQLEANITYSEPKAGTTPQTATFKLYNLSDTTLQSIVPDALFVLNAGYEQDGDDLPTIFTGTVDSVVTSRDVTTVLCTEGGNGIKSIRYTNSHPEGRTYNFILLQMIKKFKDNGIPLGRFQESDRTIQSVPEQVVYNGKLSKILTDLCKSLDYVWFICKGRLYVQPKDQPRAKEILDIKPENIIGKITPVKNKAGTPTASADTGPQGIRFKTFLNGQVGLQSYVRVADKEYEGDYDIKKLTINLNWKEGPWEMILDTEGVEYYE